jgi:hypothetical protein
MGSITNTLDQMEERISEIEEKAKEFLHSQINKEKNKQSRPQYPRSVGHD